MDTSAGDFLTAVAVVHAPSTSIGLLRLASCADSDSAFCSLFCRIYLNYTYIRIISVSKACHDKRIDDQTSSLVSWGEGDPGSSSCSSLLLTIKLNINKRLIFRLNFVLLVFLNADSS